MIEALKQKYLASFEEKILRIKSALESSDSQVLSTLIHQLAGSSGSYGFTELSELCIEIEQLIIEQQVLDAKLSSRIESLLAMMKKIQQDNCLL